MDRRKFYGLLKKYVEGKCTDEENNLIDQWYELLTDEEVPGLDESILMLVKERMMANLKAHRHAVDAPVVEMQTRKLNYRKVIIWAVAVCLPIAVLIGYFVFTKPARVNVYFSALTKDYIEKTNTYSQPVSITLEDNSIIVLQPAASIKYPLHFKPDKREIYMQGEAFFKVSKMPGHPFYVYNNSTITHVLGTEFNVKADDRLHTVEVDVHTGRVEVLENTGVFGLKGKSKNSVILTPNQRAVYKEGERKFESSLVDNPVPVFMDSVKVTAGGLFNYDEAALSSVIKDLEKAYSLEIVVDDDEVLKYPFTGNIYNRGLYSKLDVICKSMKACYEIQGTKILIRTKGCN